MSLPPAPPYAERPPQTVPPATQQLPVQDPSATTATPAPGGAPGGTTDGPNTTQVLPQADAPPVADSPTPISAPLPPPPGIEPTGPVGFVPGLPEAGATGSTVAPEERAPRDRATLLGLGLGVATVVLLQVGLLLDFSAPQSFWASVPLWSGFATLASLLGLLTFAAPRGTQPRNDRAWKLSAAGLTGLAVFWVLVVLPVANSDRGFVLTVALACLGVALWIAPGRKA